MITTESKHQCDLYRSYMKKARRKRRKYWALTILRFLALVVLSYTVFRTFLIWVTDNDTPESLALGVLLAVNFIVIAGITFLADTKAGRRTNSLKEIEEDRDKAVRNLESSVEVLIDLKELNAGFYRHQLDTIVRSERLLNALLAEFELNKGKNADSASNQNDTQEVATTHNPVAIPVPKLEGSIVQAQTSATEADTRSIMPVVNVGIVSQHVDVILHNADV